MFWLLPVAFAGPRLELVEAGAEPREAIRYAPTETPQRIEVRRVTRSEVEVGGFLPDPSPVDATQSVLWAFDPTRTDEGFTLDVAIESIVLDSTNPRAPQIEPFAGYGGQLELDARGMVVDSAFRPDPEGLNAVQTRRLATLRDWVEAAVIPFPDQPVGPGAVWRVHRTYDAEVMELGIVSTYTLVESDDGLVVLDALVKTASFPETFDSPGDGFKGRVDALEIEGQYRVQLDLTRPLPTTQRGNTAVNMELKGWKAFIPIHVSVAVRQQDDNVEK